MIYIILPEILSVFNDRVKDDENILILQFQFLILAIVAATAQAGLAGYHEAPLAYSVPLAYAAPAKAILTKTVDADFDPHPQYSYAYDVQDSITGDFKNQHETRNGDRVEGSYSLLEADGSKRTVDYTADSENGFNAIVRKEAATKIATPVIAAAPAKIAYAQPAPVGYAQPAQIKYAQAAPVSYAQPAQLNYAQPAQFSYAQPAQFSYAQPAQLRYAQPAQFSYAQPAQLNYAQQAQLSPATAHITHAQPIGKYAPSLSYAQPIAKHEPSATYGAPLAKIPASSEHTVLAAAKYAGPLSYIAHVTYSTPYFSYSH